MDNNLFATMKNFFVRSHFSSNHQYKNSDQCDAKGLTEGLTWRLENLRKHESELIGR